MSSSVFQHLSDSYVAKRYNELKAEGKSEDEIFDTIYCEDCNMDDE